MVPTYIYRSERGYIPWTELAGVKTWKEYEIFWDEIMREVERNESVADRVRKRRRVRICTHCRRSLY